MVERGAHGALHPVVMDFGLAREAGEGKGLTESGAVLGTPAYMSPEQARGEVRLLDRRTDVYSLGATLYDLLTGRPPFDDETVVNILIKVITESPPALRLVDPSQPEALELITSKCLNKEAAQRYPTARALAEDLDRYLTAGRVSARRLSFSYRAQYWTRHNRALSALIAALGVSLLCLSVFGIYTRIVNLRRAKEAEQQAELARRLGQEIKDIEWLMRMARALPLHDIEKEKQQVVQRMAALGQRFGAGSASAGHVHYGVGRGYLALNQYQQAYAELQEAERLGVQIPELDYALGRAQGELFIRALEDARRSGDASFFEKRRQELEKEYLKPALAHLGAVQRQGAGVESPHYLEGLIAFYSKRPDDALRHAEAALQQDGWLYEARKLQGDVLFAQAQEEKASGQQEAADRDFQDAIRLYEQAAQIGRSDHGLHEAIAEAWIRQLEMDVARGRDPQAKHEQALAAADRSIQASRRDSYGYTKKAYSYSFTAQYYIAKDAQAQSRKYINELIAAGKQAIALHPGDAYAHEVTGMGYIQKAQLDAGGAPAAIQESLNTGRQLFAKAIEIDPKFAWAYNDLSVSFIAEFDSQLMSGNADIEKLHSAIASLRQAVRIDDRYFNAYSNLAEAGRLWAAWQVEHGQDPERAAGQATEAAQAALKINPQFQNAFGIMGSVSLLQAEYDALLGRDLTMHAKAATDYFSRAIAINPSIIAYYGFSSYALYLILSKIPAGDAQLAAQASASIAKCYKLDANFSPCLWADALLKTLAVPKQRELSVALGRQAVLHAQPEDAPMANLMLATLLYEQARELSARKQPAVAQLDEGLAALRKALQSSPAWPRALALQSSLAWLRAGREKSDAQHGALVQLARQSLTQAQKGNPLIRE